MAFDPWQYLFLVTWLLVHVPPAFKLYIIIPSTYFILTLISIIQVHLEWCYSANMSFACEVSFGMLQTLLESQNKTNEQPPPPPILARRGKTVYQEVR